jgi:hypothetical protein
VLFSVGIGTDLSGTVKRAIALRIPCDQDSNSRSVVATIKWILSLLSTMAAERFKSRRRCPPSKEWNDAASKHMISLGAACEAKVRMFHAGSRHVRRSVPGTGKELIFSKQPNEATSLPSTGRVGQSSWLLLSSTNPKSQARF